MKRISKILSFILILTILAPSVVQAMDMDPEIVDVERLGGANRYQTAIEISKEGFNKSDIVVLASGETYTDALAGSTLAGAYDAPILLTQNNSISNETLSEISRLKAKQIFILGGNNTISTKVENKLKQANYKVERFAGDNRYHTAALIAKKVQKNTNTRTMILANGINSVDALSAGSYAAINGYTILFTNEKTIPKHTEDALKGLKTEDIIIVGGEKVINNSLLNKLKNSNYNVRRISGNSREETATMIAKEFDHVESVIVTNGYTLFDALSGAALGAKLKAPILLSRDNNLTDPTKRYLEDQNHDKSYALGGEIVLSKRVLGLLSEFHFDDNTKDRIVDLRKQWLKLKPTFNEVKFVEIPSIKNQYRLGKLTDETLNNALNMTSFLRYTAHLPNDIVLDDEFNKSAQAASIVNAANGLLTHYPDKPVDMDEELYKLGSSGASTSNIGRGYTSIIDSILRGYMEDGDPSNIDRVGHRRWILSPKLQKVGFGFVPYSNNSSSFTAMKVIDDKMWSNPHEPYDYISWPSDTATPIQHFKSNFPWSVSLNDEKYSTLNMEDIKVKLIRLNDNKIWNFSNKTSDGYFNIDTGNYGLPFTIIFRPKEEPDYVLGDSYRVIISNIRTVDGDREEVIFETSFFEL